MTIIAAARSNYFPVGQSRFMAKIVHTHTHTRNLHGTHVLFSQLLLHGHKACNALLTCHALFYGLLRYTVRCVVALLATTHYNLGHTYLIRSKGGSPVVVVW